MWLSHGAENQWPVADFYQHLSKGIDADRAMIPVDMTEREIQDFYFLGLLWIADAAGNA